MRHRARHRGAESQLTLDFEQVSETESLNVATPEDSPIRSNDLGPEHLANWSLAPQLLSIQAASYLTQIPVKTLYKWNAAGKLKGITSKVGKELRFDRDGLLRLFQHENRKTTK